jgi:hypothetical protein
MGYLTPTAKIRRAVCERAAGRCECCGIYVGEAGELAHMDHFFGRGHLAEAVSNCWLLCALNCSGDKTASRPSAAWWLARWVSFAGRYGFDAEIERAETRLAVLSQKFPEVSRG